MMEVEEDETVAAIKDLQYHSNISQILALLDDLPTTFSILPEDFEKDMDSNQHVNLILAMTNCRADSYAIENMKFIDVKIKAGRITPALVTTTAIVAGL